MATNIFPMTTCSVKASPHSGLRLCSSDPLLIDRDIDIESIVFFPIKHLSTLLHWIKLIQIPIVDDISVKIVQTLDLISLVCFLINKRLMIMFRSNFMEVCQLYVAVAAAALNSKQKSSFGEFFSLQNLYFSAL